MAEEKAIGMEILSTSGNTYTFKFGLVGQLKNRKYSNKIIRLIHVLTKPRIITNYTKLNGSIFKS
jgi:hypothetical protein